MREVIKNACDKIDPEGGNYDANGHSRWYGYARKAVELALPVQKRPVIAVSIRRDVTIPDLKSAQLSLSVTEDRPLKALKASVDIEHIRCGDFVVTLKPLPDACIGEIVLYDRQGGASHHLKQT